MTTVLVGPDTVAGVLDARSGFSALIDTGNPFNVIDGGHWNIFDRQGLIQYLPLAPSSPTLSIAGNRSVPYRLGRIWMGVVDSASGVVRSTQSKLPAVGVVCQLLGRNVGLPHPIILGLSEGILDNRWLIREPITPVAGSENRYDIGPRLGQQWWLQDIRP